MEIAPAGSRCSVPAVLPRLLRALDAIRGIDVACSTGYGIWAPDSAGPHPSWQEALLSIADHHDRITGWRPALETSSAASGGLPADLEFRLRCYQLHIGLDAMTYNAFTSRFDDLARNAEQTMALI
jgi:hypothetical protein